MYETVTVKPIILRNEHMLIQTNSEKDGYQTLPVGAPGPRPHLHSLDSWEELVNQEATYNLPVPIGSVRTPAHGTPDLPCCWWSLFLQLCSLTPQGQCLLLPSAHSMRLRLSLRNHCLPASRPCNLTLWAATQSPSFSFAVQQPSAIVMRPFYPTLA